MVLDCGRFARLADWNRRLTFMERCIGCGIAAQEHPVVALGQWPDGVAIGGDVNPRGFSAAPVCRPCHVEPAHRTLGRIDGTFFERKDAFVARRFAGDPSLHL